MAASLRFRHRPSLPSALSSAQSSVLLKRGLGCRWVLLSPTNLQAGQKARRKAWHLRRPGYRSACVAFGVWCVKSQRFVMNPLAGLPKANEKADPRRHRRALTEGELVALLDAAQRRPLLEARTVRRGKRSGETAAQLRPETVARLEMLGRERALIYKSLVLTGLRKSELASLTAGQLDLDDPMPCAFLHAADEKNRQGSQIPLRVDLAADLRRWLADKLATVQESARQTDEPIPTRLPGDTPLFNVPTGLVRILNRDLRLAGIPKRDDRGWTVDVHSLRHSFGTLMEKGGVPLRTAQAAMRHSDPSLTANVYTDPRLLDVAGALDALPVLPLEDRPCAEPKRATGTFDVAASLAPMLAPTPDDSGTRQSIVGKAACGSDVRGNRKGDHKPRHNKDLRQPKATAGNQKQNGRYRTRTSDFFLVRTSRATVNTTKKAA